MKRDFSAGCTHNNLPHSNNRRTNCHTWKNIYHIEWALRKWLACCLWAKRISMYNLTSVFFSWLHITINLIPQRENWWLIVNWYDGCSWFVSCPEWWLITSDYHRSTYISIEVCIPKCYMVCGAYVCIRMPLPRTNTTMILNGKIYEKWIVECITCQYIVHNLYNIGMNYISKYIILLVILHTRIASEYIILNL